MSRFRFLRLVEGAPEGAPAEVHTDPPEHPAVPAVPDPVQSSTEDPVAALAATVDALAAKVAALTADVEGKINPPEHTDTRPGKPPWTHRGFGGHKS